jgi:RES domain-containing protein
LKTFSEETLFESLDRIEPIRFEAIVTSARPFFELCENDPPDWLYTSCEAKRYNPKGVACVYFALGGRTARAEHACNGNSDVQPIVFYSAKVRLAHTLDLTSLKILKTLGLTRAQLFEDWERKKQWPTGILGGVIAKHPQFSAILFPSAAAREAGFKGENIVIFRDSIKRPDLVHILGPTKTPLQKWPV